MKYVIRSARNFSQAAKSNVASVATTNTLTSSSPYSPGRATPAASETAG